MEPTTTRLLRWGWRSALLWLPGALAGFLAAAYSFQGFCETRAELDASSDMDWYLVQITSAGDFFAVAGSLIEEWAQILRLDLLQRPLTSRATRGFFGLRLCCTLLSTLLSFVHQARPKSTVSAPDVQMLLHAAVCVLLTLFTVAVLHALSGSVEVVEQTAKDKASAAKIARGTRVLALLVFVANATSIASHAGSVMVWEDVLQKEGPTGLEALLGTETQGDTFIAGVLEEDGIFKRKAKDCTLDGNEDDAEAFGSVASPNAMSWRAQMVSMYGEQSTTWNPDFPPIAAAPIAGAVTASTQTGQAAARAACSEADFRRAVQDFYDGRTRDVLLVCLAGLCSLVTGAVTALLSGFWGPKGAAERLHKALAEAGELTSSALASSQRIAYAGSIRPRRGGRCVASFPGKCTQAWEALTTKDHDFSVACVFLTDRESGLGQHSLDPDRSDGGCYCARLYGRRFPADAYLRVLPSPTTPAEREGYPEKRNFARADAEAMGLILLEQKAVPSAFWPVALWLAQRRAGAACAKNDGRAPWGCRWFHEWAENVHKAVALGQELVVCFADGLVGQPEGLGLSQKSEVAWMQEMQQKRGQGYACTHRDALAIDPVDAQHH